MHKFIARFISAVSLGLVLSSACMADVLYLRDGRSFQGVIVEDNSREVAIDTKISGIRTTLTFSKREVERVEHKTLPDNFFEEESDVPQQQPANEDNLPARIKRSKHSSTPYLEIPMEGTFGEDILPGGVSDALDFASRRQIEHIVFRIDSPGGAIWAAEEIAEIMKNRDDEFVYHAVVQSAISASIWVVFSCDDIHIAPEGTIGAAVVFLLDRTTGEIDVDKKMNSALAASVAAICERKGHEPALARAMMLPEAELWAYRDELGRMRLSGAHIDEAVASDIEEVDSAETILTLTAQEALRYGVASAVGKESVADVGASLALAGWRKIGNFGEAAMRKARDRQQDLDGDATDLRKEVPLLLMRINDNKSLAEFKDPLRYSYDYNYRTNILSQHAQRVWRQRTDECHSYWDKVQRHAKELQRVLEMGERVGVEPPELGFDIADLLDRCKTEMDRLKKQRNRIYR